MSGVVLRDYQRGALDGLWRYFATHPVGNPLLVLPTGAGKSLLAATLIYEALRDYPGTRVLLLTHVRELIEQDLAALRRVWPDAPVGVYSAGLGRRDSDQPILMAGIQSVYRRAYELPPYDLVLIDEAHLVPHDGDGMYRTFLEAERLQSPDVRCVGLTATPYRMTTGSLIDGGGIWTDIAHEVGLDELVRDGYLSRLVSRASTAVSVDLGAVRVQRGEYVLADLDAAMRGDVTERALREAVSLAGARRSWLVYCCTVDHAVQARDVLRTLGVTAECVHGETPADERARILADFRAGTIRAVTNCMVLTTGFDAPAVDLIAFLRPTKSPGLYVQMAGRGMRIAPGKTDCLCLDYARLIETHGPVDTVRVRRRPVALGGGTEVQGVPCRVCIGCGAPVPIQAHECPECGTVLPRLQQHHDDTASVRAIMSADVVRTWHDVSGVRYARHERDGKRTSLRVDYWGQRVIVASEWVCLEHDGYPRARACAWWRARAGASSPVPVRVDDALARTDELRRPAMVATVPDGKYHKIVEVTW